MQEFINFLKDGKYRDAFDWMEREASYFGFSRDVPNLVALMKNECPISAEKFCASLVGVMKKLQNTADGRLQATRQTFPYVQFLPNRRSFNPDLMDYIMSSRVHPTTLQQIFQVAFCFYDNGKLRGNLELDEFWWRMPLI